MDVEPTLVGNGSGHLGQQLVHRRGYDVHVFRVRAGLMRIRGTLVDEKPAGLHIEGDPDPITIHHMVVDLFVETPAMAIAAVDVVFEEHPHEQCPRIIHSYQSLVGLVIGRGFTHKVRELFGGPRGCTHTTALLQAMVPVVVQADWSMKVLDERERSDLVDRSPASPDQRRARWVGNVNTCHVWEAGSAHVTFLEAGGELSPPDAFRRRAIERGVPEVEWKRQFDR